MKHKKVIEHYINKFCKKQEETFQGWLNDNIGTYAMINDTYLSYSDIVYDINSNQPAGLIFKWYKEQIENAPIAINYYSYTKTNEI